MLRGLSAFLLSLLLSGASLAGVARAFDWRKPVPPIHHNGPIIEYEPVIITPQAFRADAYACSTEDRVDWPADPPSGNQRPWRRAPENTSWSPVYCARIDVSGQIVTLQLAGGSGNAEADQWLARDLRAMRFTAARWRGRPVSAWHRVVIALPGRPAGSDGKPHRGPELELHFVG
jgi:hypothetical protein